MKCLCSFRAREHCSAFIPPFLLMKQNPKWWWEENSGNHSGPDQAPAKWRLARHPPVILISPCLHTHTRRNKPPFCLGPTTRLPDTFSQLWSNRQSTKGTRCFTDTHLPLPLSSVRCTAAEEPRRNNADTLFFSRNILPLLAQSVSLFFLLHLWT